MGEWLKRRAAERGETITTFAPPPNRRGPEYWFAVVAAVLGGATCLGWALIPYFPLRTALMLGGGMAAVSVSFIGLYVLAFSFMRAIPVSIKVTGPLFLAASLLGGGSAGYELWKQASDSQREANGEEVPDLVRARARGWVASKQGQ